MMTAKASGFLTISSRPSRIHVTAEDDDFDKTFIRHLEGEGFDVRDLSWESGDRAYRNELADLAHDLEPGAIVCNHSFWQRSIRLSGLPH